jgi:predicted phage-related endonuclease
MSEPAREVREIVSTGAWLDWRREDITASRLPALFGLNPYLSREQLADIMRGSTGAGTGSVPDSPAMRRGRILEPAVAAALAEERPELPPLVKATTYHRVPEWRLGCTPDYWCGDEGLVQCKTVSPQQWQAWHGKVPTGYVIQTLCEMMVTGRRWGLLAVLEVSPSYPLHIAAVPRHEKAERSILNAVAAWWRAFDAGELPGTAAGAAELEAAFDDGSWIDLSADNALPGILDERAALKATTSDAERRLKELDYEIKNRMGRASRGWLPGWDISFGTQHRREVLIPAKDMRVLRVRAARAVSEGGGEEGAA